MADKKYCGRIAWFVVRKKGGQAPGERTRLGDGDVHETCRFETRLVNYRTASTRFSSEQFFEHATTEPCCGLKQGVSHPSFDRPGGMRLKAFNRR